MRIVFLKANGDYLKTKIIATIGSPQKNMCKPNGKFVKDVTPNEFLNWFFQKKTELPKKLPKKDMNPPFLIDIIRLNMAHYKDDDTNPPQLEVLKWLKRNREKLGNNVAILADLPGPKIRLCIDAYRNLSEEKKSFLLGKGIKVEVIKDDDNQETKIKLILQEGTIFKIYFGSSELSEKYPIAKVYDEPFESMVKKIDNDYENLSAFISAKKRGRQKIRISLGDGAVHLDVKSEKKGLVSCEVTKGGEVSENTGLTIIGAVLDMPTFLEKDKKAIDFLLKNDDGFVAYIGVSFVKNANDVLQVRYYIEERIKEKLKTSLILEDYTEITSFDKLVRVLSPLIIAKIETKQAIENIDEILDVSDGVMIARGDLALNFPPERVPAIQKKIIQLCNIRGKPTITATQMLLSMVNNLSPSRAEATDVFNAILDKTTAVMLSDETAKGSYPYQSVKMMIDIALEAENFSESLDLKSNNKSDKQKSNSTEHDLIAKNLKIKLDRQRFQEIRLGSDSIISVCDNRFRIEIAKMAEGVSQALEDNNKFERKICNWRRDFYAEKLLKIKNQATTDSISESACILSEEEEYKAIFVSTWTGRTARMISRFHPDTKIIPILRDEANTRKMILSYGSYPINIGMKNNDKKILSNTEEIFEIAGFDALNKGYIQKNDTVVFVGGSPLWSIGEANLIQIKKLG